MKTPPFLLLAALLFWGWQSGHLIAGAALGAVLEASRYLPFRWDLDDADFTRILRFCTVLILAQLTYSFTSNEGGGLYDMINGNTASTVVKSTVFSATQFLRWLPVTFFAFLLAQSYNVRPAVPLAGISMIFRWRRSRGYDDAVARYLDVSYPYFMLCLFSAGIQPNNGSQLYFWGAAGLMAWALWALRPSRYGIFVWIAALAVVIGLGFSGVTGINSMQRVIQNLNAAWMARLFSNRTDPLQSMTSMGRIGRLKLSPRIVIRLQPHEPGRVPLYLREASYRNYQASKMTWYAGGSLGDFEYFPSETNNTTWILQPDRLKTDGVNIACYLNGWSRELQAPEGVLPVPSGCTRLENLPSNTSLKKNGNGVLLAAGNGLLIFDAFYRPGPTIDLPPDLDSTNRFDLVVPTNDLPAIESAIKELQLPFGADDLQKRQALMRFFFDKFTYSTWQGVDKKADADGTPLAKFLTTSRSGHCEYFASATVLLLRKLGIPARYAVGYYVHEPRGAGYVVRERDAHAWCLVWNRATKCWEDFDTTPASWVAVESQRSGFREWPSDLWSWLKFQFAKFRWGQAHLQKYVFWSLIPVLLVLVYLIIFRRRRKLRGAGGKDRHAAQIVWPGLDSEFYRLEEKLAALGVPRQPGEALSDWLERALPAPALGELREPLRALLQLHYRHRFDPRGLSAPEREELRRKAAEALQRISSS